MNIPVEDAEKNDWKTGEDDIIQLNVPFVKNCHRAETTPVSVEIVRESQGDVFVEKVQDEA